MKPINSTSSGVKKDLFSKSNAFILKCIESGRENNSKKTKKEILYSFEKALNENIDAAFKSLLFIRDPLVGLGHRSIFKLC